MKLLPKVLQDHIIHPWRLVFKVRDHHQSAIMCLRVFERVWIQYVGKLECFDAKTTEIIFYYCQANFYRFCTAA